MKRIEKLAIVLIILWVLTLFPNWLTTLILPRLYGEELYKQMSLTLTTLSGLRNLLVFSVHIGLACWLYLEAKRLHHAKWIWVLLALLFGIPAAILYLLSRIIQELEFSRNTQGTRQQTPAGDRLKVPPEE